MKHVIALLIISVLVGCGSSQLAPETDRKLEFIEQTGVPRAESYRRALAHLAKTFVDANSAIKLRDEQGSQIVAQANVSCNALRPALMMLDFDLRFSLDFQAKDDRIRVAFEDLRIVTREGAVSAVGQIGNKADLEKVKVQCIEPIRAQLLGAVKSSAEVKKADW